MALEPGTRLGPYEIVELRGKGGMGEVYRARDTRLDRDVAIKVLPTELSEDSTFKGRFEREAKTISQLQHPNVCALYDVGSEDGVDFLVMEYLEGQTLGDRLRKGPLKIDDVLRIGGEIAEAIEAAHGHGIVHRDLKPGNVILTGSGAKVVDFGLAREVAPLDGVDTEAATLPGTVTEEGRIAGTIPYMAPELLEGQTATPRSDIWALGCVLWEMTTGERPFQGDGRASLISAIMSADLEPLSSTQSTAPRRLDWVVDNCLRKDSEKRWRAIGDVHLELAAIARDLNEGTSAPTLARPRVRLALLGWLGIGVLVAGIGLYLAFGRLPDPAPGPVRRLSFNLASTEPLSPVFRSFTPQAFLALSPDGSVLVYVAQIEGVRQLVHRRLDRLESRILNGTEGAYSVYFSPDGESVAFLTYPEAKLKKVALDGGGPVTLADTPQVFGASWGDDGYIYFSPRRTVGVVRVSALGGETEVVSPPEGREWYRGWPYVLPGAQALLLRHGATLSLQDARLVALSLASRETRALLEGAESPVYTPTGHLVFHDSQSGGLMAAPFDLDRLELTGVPLDVTESRMSSSQEPRPRWALSESGVLVYAPVGEVVQFGWDVVLVDRDGNEEPTSLPRISAGSTVRFSPDGRRVALNYSDASGDHDVWVYDLTGRPPVRLTFDQPRYDGISIWTPDGEKVVFSSGQSEQEPFLSLFWKEASGAVPVKQLTMPSGRNHIPISFSPDGKILFFQEYLTTGQSPQNWEADIGMLDLGAGPDAATELLLQESYNELLPMISPDGRWLAYMSDESGRFEVYVKPFPDLDVKWQISTGGGESPVWNPQGGELFYSSGKALMAVPIETEPTFTLLGPPRLLFEGPYLLELGGFDVSPDGQQFLVAKLSDAEGGSELIIVENWFEELERLVPTS